MRKKIIIIIIIMKNEKKNLCKKNLEWATAQIILQEFNCIAIGGRFINLRKCIAVG